MKVHQCIYISEARSLVDSEQLDSILGSARAFNVENNITGMLLYRSQTFLQMLEGGADDVRGLMKSRIERDIRHRAITVLQEHEVEQRSFCNWSMGFANLDADSTHESIAYSNFFEDGFTNELVAPRFDVAHKLLLSFRQQG